ncbi:hypothetical protein RRG08_021941 [Elysia crispata]|uniref:Uncharacterized protein n=1 Tax=Elysia crispata TaxID=231223 RepID=A0AAE1ADM8_9GAST|nr:hypothetical protein RRG08_021941 [Elysia crispata]
MLIVVIEMLGVVLDPIFRVAHDSLLSYAEDIASNATDSLFSHCGHKEKTPQAWQAQASSQLASRREMRRKRILTPARNSWPHNQPP